VAFHFLIGGTPFAWRRAGRDRRTGRTFTDPKAEAHKRTVAFEAALRWGDRPPLFCPVKMLVICTFQTPDSWSKRLRAEAAAGRIYHDSDPDGDNLQKQIADALKFIAFVDDNQIGDGRTVKRYGDGARTEVWLVPAGDGALPTKAQQRRGAKWAAGGYAEAMAKTAGGWARAQARLEAMRRG
jgi:Holliday junction resolvase RusA-like endonuclease